MFVKTQREFSPRAHVQKSRTSWAASYSCTTAGDKKVLSRMARDTAAHLLIANLCFATKSFVTRNSSTSIFMESALLKLKNKARVTSYFLSLNSGKG